MLLKNPVTIVFDPSNKVHRAAVHALLKRKTWAETSLRFKHDPEYGSVADQVRAKLLLWYVEQEEARGMKRAKRVA